MCYPLLSPRIHVALLTLFDGLLAEPVLSLAGIPCSSAISLKVGLSEMDRFLLRLFPSRWFRNRFRPPRSLPADAEMHS
jgi:hypothetical protein